MSELVLSQLRGLVPGTEEAEEQAPPRRRRVLVDRDGRIAIGDDAAVEGEERRLSEIPPAVFAAG